LQVSLQRLDDWADRLQVALPALLARKQQQLAVASAGLRPQAIRADMQKISERLKELQQRLQAAGLRYLDTREERLRFMASQLESVNYQKVLARGFALVKDSAGTLVTTAAGAKEKAELTVTFKDGELKVKPQA
jgi:exodeoxyribonuclease VII large subunit